MVINRFIKDKKGIIITDAIVSILVILLFIGIITSLVTSIVFEKTRIKLNSAQIDYMTNILEHIEKITYAYTTENNIINYINNMNPEYISAGTTTEELTTKYRVYVDVKNHNQIEGNTDKYDFIKVITLNIETTLSNKQYSMEVSRIKKAGISEVKDILENE